MSANHTEHSVVDIHVDKVVKVEDEVEVEGVGVGKVEDDDDEDVDDVKVEKVVGEVGVKDVVDVVHWA